MKNGNGGKNSPLRVYFAGKIGFPKLPGSNQLVCEYGSDWRFSIFTKEKAGFAHKVGINAEFQIDEKHTYCGPFFRSEHGDVCDGHLNYADIAERCKSQIDSCDYVFCWINHPECFGTLVEIGYASARSKRVIVGVASGPVADQYSSEFFFASRFASGVCLDVYGDPKEMWDRFFHWSPRDLHMSPPRTIRKRRVVLVPTDVIVNPEECYVYLIREIATGRMKIGTAQDIAERIKTLQCGNPDELELVAWMRGSFQLERELHQRFNRNRLRGEWFLHDRSILEYFYQNGFYADSNTIKDKSIKSMVDPFATVENKA